VLLSWVERERNAGASPSAPNAERVDSAESRGVRRAVEAATALLVATAACDLTGLAGASFYLLVAGVPVAAVAGLLCFGKVVYGGAAGGRARLQAILLGLLLAAIVLGAAAREPSIGNGVVPPGATIALALGLALLAAQALIALAPSRR